MASPRIHRSSRTPRSSCEVPETRLYVATWPDVLEDVAYAASGAYGDRVAAVELRVVEVQLRQLKQLLREFERRRVTIVATEFERARDVRARVRLEVRHR